MYLTELNGIFLIDIIFYTFLIICVIKETAKIRELQLELRNVRSKNEELTTQYDQVREMRHNFGNFVQALCGYVEVKNIKGIEEMCSRVQRETHELHEVKDTNIERISNAALEKLIVNKVLLAKQKNINIKINSKTNLRDLKISTYDMCKMMGIFLDNAIEAAADSKGKNVEIRIFENKKSRKKIICIENTYKGLVDLTQIYNKGYTTKNHETESHGLGLWSVKKIVQANDEIKVYTKAKDKFCQQIEINI